MINGGRAARRMDEEGEMEPRRERVCEAAVYLPNKLDRISSIIKQRDGENRHTHTHTCTSIFQCLCHTHLQINILAHLHVSISEHFRFSYPCVTVIFAFSAVCVYTCVWLCLLKTVSHRIKLC